ncbi:MAG: PDZ domain-containing protein [Erysipelotrichaceae bacterium]|nr:PDZ domain-containing protein [Erysipelotrichaceae bacterium]
MEDNNEYYFDLQKVPLKSEREEKKKKRWKILFVFFLCLFCFVTGILSGYLILKKVHPTYQADAKNVMGEIEYLMDHYWLYSKDYDDLTKELEDKALYGMTDFDYDPYTSYMSAAEMDQFSTSINMNYVGIGVEYSYINDIALIKKVFKNSPAEQAGIEAGDIIKMIDGVPLEGMTTDDIRERVIGEEGTEVVISVLRGAEVLDIPIIRGPVDSTVYAYRENDYVVLELNSFGVDSGSRCMTYLDECTDLSKIIIDLRDNSGGYQSSVKEISGLFIGNEQVYLRQKDAKGLETVDVTSCKKTYDNFKEIVVLINENTASAAEVLAICLKEQHPDVTLVGVTTYGKGVIQTNRVLNNDGVLKMTAYYWYSPNGASIHGTGVTPDVEVRMPEIYYEYYYALAEDESYDYDSVSSVVKTAQLALAYLDYDLDRTDGYFDQRFADALKAFKAANGMPQDSLLDARTFEVIISEVNRQMANNPDKDVQMKKAKEILNGNQR